jgi:hypothetical protein
VAYDTKGAEPTESQKETFRHMLDALDDRQQRLGVPEEL